MKCGPRNDGAPADHFALGLRTPVRLDSRRDVPWKGFSNSSLDVGAIDREATSLLDVASGAEEAWELSHLANVASAQITVNFAVFWPLASVGQAIALPGPCHGRGFCGSIPSAPSVEFRPSGRVNWGYPLVGTRAPGARSAGPPRSAP